MLFSKFIHHSTRGSALALTLLLGSALLAEEKLDLTPETVVKRVGEDIRYLASSDLEGRGVETKGIQVAAEYIKKEFQRIGLPSGVPDGSYYQPFTVNGLDKLKREETKLVFTKPDGSTKELVIGTDYQPQLAGAQNEVTGELVFVGYGLKVDEVKMDDYADLDLTGKIAVVIRREPRDGDEDGPFQGPNPSPHALIRTKIAHLIERKAAGVILVNDVVTAPEDAKDVLPTPDFFGSNQYAIPFAQIKQSVFNDMIAGGVIETKDGKKLNNLAEISAEIEANLTYLSKPLAGWKATMVARAESVSTDNIIAVIEGEGPHADETIVVGAHYDHLGFGGYGSRTPDRREIHPGADDNATGTAAVLELARRFAVAEKKPARRIVFIAFSGEERGLLGSFHYVANPLFPLEKTVAMVNFDMIGWLRDDKLTVYGVGTGDTFEKQLNAANATTALKLQLSNSSFAGSDHLPFIGREIPAVFIHTGLTATYHTPDDNYDSINVEGAAKVIDYSEAFIKELANAAERPKYSNARPQRGTRGPSLGLRPEFNPDQEGFTVRAVTEGGPAEKAGIKVGDIVLTINEEPIEDQAALRELLQDATPDSKLELKVKREEMVIDIEVVLTRPMPAPGEEKK